MPPKQTPFARVFLTNIDFDLTENDIYNLIRDRTGVIASCVEIRRLSGYSPIASVDVFDVELANRIIKMMDGQVLMSEDKLLRVSTECKEFTQHDRPNPISQLKKWPKIVKDIATQNPAASSAAAGFFNPANVPEKKLDQPILKSNSRAGVTLRPPWPLECINWDQHKLVAAMAANTYSDTPWLTTNNGTTIVFHPGLFPNESSSSRVASFYSY